MVYCAFSGMTSTFNSWSAVPMRRAATPSLNAGRDRSTMAVGAWYSRPSYQKARAHSTGERQPQVKKLYQGTSRMRPRKAITLT